MAVTWTKSYETSTLGDMPTSSANQWSQGFTVRSGTLEFLTLRYNLTYKVGTPVAGSDISALVDSLRIIVNGETAHDFTAGYSANDLTVASQYNYLLNKTGGRCVEVSQTDVKVREGYINIPLGRVLNSQGQNRIECIVNWSAAAQEIDSGTLEWWCRYNSATETMTTVVPATSFTSSASTAQIVVRCPTNLPAGSSIAGLLILNDSQEDQIGSSGIRINALSDFGVTTDQWRMINSDLMNSIAFNNGSVGAGAGLPEALVYAQKLKGALFIPTFNLSLGDVQVILDSSAATTRLFFPVITTPIGGKLKQEQVQQARLAGNTSKSILSNDLQ